MNEEDSKMVFDNFMENKWIYDHVNKICTYKDDLRLQIKLQNIRIRKDDEELIGGQWNDFFAKYPNSKLVSLNLMYNDAIVSGLTNLLFNDIVVPLPIGANMINEFYENELDIAKMFSDDKSSFDKILSGSKKRKKNY